MTGVQFPAGHGRKFFYFIFSLSYRNQTASGLDQTSYPTDTGGSFPGSKVAGALGCSAEVKNAWSYTSTPQYVFMTWYLIKQWIHLHGVVLS
jgi:hypothetical protein